MIDLHASPTAPLHRMMVIRQFETALSRLPDPGFQLLSIGEEAVAVGLASALQPGDQLLSGGRAIGPALARGVEPGPLMAELLGKVDGPNRGKAGRGHMADPSAGFFGAHAVVGGNISIAAGVALAAMMDGRNALAAVLFGDGACGSGALHETLNIAAKWRLPLLFVCNNNQFSVSTPRTAALAPSRLSDIGRAFGMPAADVDGQDLAAVSETMAWATAHIRGGGGPVFVECSSLRFAPHSTAGRETRSRDELARVRARCPIEIEAARLTGVSLLADDARAAMQEDAAAIVSDALAFAAQSSYPDPREVLSDVR